MGRAQMKMMKAWNLVRVALLWARKGGVFKNRLLMFKDLPKCVKSLHDHRHSGAAYVHRRRDPCALHYGERQFSFDDTPIIHVKMHRPASLRFRMPHIPCINPPVDFDFDFDFDGRSNADADDQIAFSDEYDNNADDDHQCCDDDDGGEEIDTKAEQFIAKFYEQIKLQRQISYLRYNEMLAGGAN
ncbi:PREDICTED: uncharacterized protein LOC109191254 [Ipomoea nil]|uniref:uncharacterized protein LOC109191254 n=1 Tax=Ipomoea nil TaxID=35883 RepID=UPI000900C3DD|nr:PREDICTED: uncharacterized protein LOC109191254 [Ipomoea nil]